MGAADDWVGRGRELAVLDEALGRLAEGEGGAVSISGAPGIGKSRLLDEAGRRAEVRGALLFEGQASELESAFPFGVMVDALDPYLASLAPGSLRTLSEAQHRLLGAVFPALTERHREVSPIAAERFRCYRAVRALLGVLAAKQPVVLALDDLHWTDAASLELLDHLLRRAPDPPVLMLLSYRTGFASRAFSRLGHRLELGPLEREEADALVGEDLGPAVQADLYRESGGNPFYLHQLVRAKRRGGSAPRGDLLDELGTDVPLAVREALARELAELGDRTRCVLQSAAVAGDPFTPELVAELAGERPDAVHAALDQAIAVELVRSTDTPVLFRFRHPIVRRAVYASAGAAWRVGAHARAAQLLAASGASPLGRAHHVERSAARGDEDAVAVLTAAGHAVGTVAPASAARWFGAALRLLPEDAQPPQRLALLGPLASALASAGRLQESRKALVEMLESLPLSLLQERTRVIAFTGLLDRLLGRHGKTRDLLEETLSGVEDRSSPEAAGLQLELAADRLSLGDWTRMREHAQIGWTIAATGAEGLRARAACLLGLAEYGVGRVVGARERCAEAVALVDAPGAEARGVHLDALDWLGWLELGLEEHTAALGHFARGLRIGRASGAGHLLSTMTFGLVVGCVRSGRLPEAVEHSDTMLELGRLSGSGPLLLWAHGLRALVELRRGALGAALDQGAQALRLTERVAANPLSAVSGGWLGEALIEAGQPARGREQILRALGGPELPGVELPGRPYFYDVLAGADTALRRADEAASWAQAASQTAAGLGLAGPRGAALHAAAVVEPDPAAGAWLAQRAADLLAPAHPIEAARARTLAGRWLGVAGDRQRALASLRRATTELAALGARHYATQAVRERRSLGEHVAHAGRAREGVTGLASLSQREHQVASLVEDRLTNREIAKRLVLSEKTVERHLSRIFVKLNARSRVEVARQFRADETAA